LSIRLIGKQVKGLPGLGGLKQLKEADKVVVMLKEVAMVNASRNDLVYPGLADMSGIPGHGVIVAD
jgi:hypothetical protein